MSKHNGDEIKAQTEVAGNIGDNVVKGYKAIENCVVGGYKKIEEGVVGGYKKMEEGVVGAYKKVEDKFVDKFLIHEGESVEDAKKRLAKVQADREADRKMGNQ